MQQGTGLEGSLGAAVVEVQGPRKGHSNRDPKAVRSRLCGKSCGKSTPGRGNGEAEGPEAGAWPTYSSKSVDANVEQREGTRRAGQRGRREGPVLS